MSEGAFDAFLRRPAEDCIIGGAGGRPTCHDCGGTGVLEVGGHCTHGTRRGDDRPCTDACVMAEACPGCGGTGIKEATN